MKKKTPEKIHHYTSIQSLEAILKNRTIRFSTLAKVNDENEGETQEIGNLGKYIFVSCWTESANENDWMWEMYGDNFKGVKISLSFPPFNVYNDGGISSITPLNGKLEKDYFILPSPENFYFLIEYTNDEENLKPKTIYYYWGQGRFEFGKVGKCKTPNPWKIEEELRFIIYTLPKSKIYNFEQEPEFFIDDAISMMKNNSDIYTSFIDMKIIEESFNNMAITIGSEVSIKEKMKIIEMVNLYNPKALIKLND